MQPKVAKSLIDGQWIEGDGDALERHDPGGSGDVVSTVRPLGTQEVRDAIAAARSASKTWCATPIHERARILDVAADLFEERADQLATLLTLEQGKLLAEATSETLRAASVLRYFAGQKDRRSGDLYAPPRVNEIVRVERRAVGVVGLITPWNFPIAISVWKLAPALVYGNTVVWKPSTPVPAVSEAIADILVTAGVPAGVLNLVHAGATSVAPMITSGHVDAISFTGSTQVGTTIVGEAAAKLTPVQAEMGGKNTAIVCPDTNIAAAADSIVTSAMGSAGQRCTGTERLLVHAEVADALASEIAVRVRELRLGHGLDPGSDIGPVITQAAKAEIDAVIEKACSQGAEVIAQSGSPQGDAANGSFVRPTVLRLGEQAVDVWDDEVFGPVLGMRTFDDLERAIDEANRTPYGLSASIYTDHHPSMELAAQTLDVGVMHINDGTIGADPHIPFGGTKSSGYGPKEQGTAAREFYTRSKTIYQRTRV